jgi:myo-inositol-1-phosphate synthase
VTDERVGLWLIGALGDVATTAAVGLAAVARGLAPPAGLVTEAAWLKARGLVPLDRIVLGGHDVRQGSPVEAARDVARNARLFPLELVDQVAPELERFERRIRPGAAFGCARPVLDLEGAAARARRTAGRRDALAAIRADLRAFKDELGLGSVVVIHVASTEPLVADLPELATEAGLRGLVASDDERLPASVLYALAAIDEGCAYVNFTPSLGATAGVVAVAEKARVPLAGRDGKTGETLLRSALAPLFLARNLDVLSWTGFNVLGNRDGEVLADPGANAQKTRSKDSVLRAILGDKLGETLTRIDFVRSLGDWKTAWDLVHFRGFLGAEMSLELTWRGADSALAAPLVLDLARLIDLARRRGRRGVVRELACFFKDPIGVTEHAFSKQVDWLADFVGES